MCRRARDEPNDFIDNAAAVLTGAAGDARG
jgi:hypothetical protein